MYRYVGVKAAYVSLCSFTNFLGVGQRFLFLGFFFVAKVVIIPRKV